MRRLLRWLFALVLARILGRPRASREAEPERAAGEEGPPEGREVPADARSETVVIFALLGAAALAGGFIVFYVAFPDTQLLGLTLGLALALLGLAAALAGKRVVAQEKASEPYHDFGDEDRQEEVAGLVEQSAEGVSRRRLIGGAAGLAGATLGGAALFPVASIGPNVGEKIYRTPWRAGRRVVGVGGEPITADGLAEGTFVTGFPEGASRSELGAPLIVAKLPPEELDMPPDRRRGAPEGIVAFSKVCPHAGCAVSILREPKYPPVEPSRALVCPCHYSTFDPARAGKLLFGPAGRDLPQLPLRINAAGELEAAGDLSDHPGPSYGGSRLRS